jgi:hypothetical protein
VVLADRPEANVQEICRRFNISRRFGTYVDGGHGFAGLNVDDRNCSIRGIGNKYPAIIAVCRDTDRFAADADFGDLVKIIGIRVENADRMSMSIRILPISALQPKQIRVSSGAIWKRYGAVEKSRNYLLPASAGLKVVIFYSFLVATVR